MKTKNDIKKKNFSVWNQIKGATNVRKRLTQSRHPSFTIVRSRERMARATESHEQYGARHAGSTQVS